MNIPGHATPGIKTSIAAFTRNINEFKLIYNKLHIFLFIAFCLVFAPKVHAQLCQPLDTSVWIVDNVATSIQITIEGVLNNDLANPAQGLCGVQLQFEHTQLSDLIILLTSPSGDEVTLVGPSIVNFPTPFSNWDVVFTRCGFPASPDPGFPQIWTNEAPWAAFGNYNGVYYPNEGCLEDFNNGPVNGTWSLAILDNIAFDAGRLLGITLIFCDPTGIDCGLCEADAGTFPADTLQYCEGDPELVFGNPVDWLSVAPDTTFYRQLYFSYFKDTVLSVSPPFDFSQGEPGLYRICGLSYHPNDSSYVEQIVPLMPFKELSELVEAPNSIFCSDFSDQCLLIQINPTGFIQDTTLYFCPGDTIYFEQTPYYESGDYFLVDHSDSLCGSATLLQLRYYDLTAEIQTDNHILSCDNNLTTLHAIISDPDENITFQWITEGGNFVSALDTLSVVVSQPGIYQIVLEKNMCFDTSSVVVVSDGSLPEFLAIGNTISCQSDSVLIEFIPVSDVDSIQWTGPGGNVFFGLDPYVSVPGQYLLEVTGMDGCVAFSSVNIDIDTIYPKAFLSADTLNCLDTLITLGFSSSDLITDVYWIELDTHQAEPMASNPGWYHVVYSGPNGCESMDSIVVPSDFRYPRIDIQFDTLTCLNDPVMLDLVHSEENLIVDWTTPSDEHFDTEDLWISTGGIYTVSVINEFSCRKDTSVFVVEDLVAPAVILPDSIFIPCGTNAIELTAIFPSGYDWLRWTGPGQFLSDQENPTVDKTGVYILEVAGKNGCIRFDSIIVTPPPEIPDVDFDIIPIDCQTSTGQIQVLYTGNLSFDWVDPQGNTTFGPSVSSSFGGDFQLLITDLLSSCTSSQIVPLPVDTIAPELVLNQPEILSCLKDTIQLSADVVGNVTSIHWSGPGTDDWGTGIDVTLAGWYYVELTGLNGCIRKDSIEVFYTPDFLSPSGPFFIDCTTDSVQLIVDAIPDATYLWFFDGMNVAAGPDPYVTDPGWYTVIVETPNACKDTLDLELVNDQMLPEFTLSASGDLNCIDSSVWLQAVLLSDIIQFEWLDPGIQSGGLSIEVDSAGWYHFSATGTNHCSTIDSVEVRIDRHFPVVEAIGDSTNCYNDSEYFRIDANIEGPYQSVLWEGPDFFTSNSLVNAVQDTGVYVLRVEGSPGCYSYDSAWVVTDTIPPEIDFNPVQMLTCFRESVQLSFDPKGPLHAIEWTGPSNFTADTNPVSVDVAGTYWLQIRGENGCTNQATIEIKQNKLKPYVSLNASEITCNHPKVPILLNTTAVNYFATWTGPNNYLFTGVPAIVKDTGTYVVTVTDLSNGCEQTASIQIEADFEVPLVITRDFNLGCLGDSIDISIASVPEEVTVLWSGPNGFFASGKTVRALLPGIYLANVIRMDNGCSAIGQVSLSDEPDYPEFQLVYEPLNCGRDTTQLILSDTVQWQSALWTGPGGFGSTEFHPWIWQEGAYTVTITGNNGCVSDSLLVITKDTLAPLVDIQYDDFIQCEKNTAYLNATNSSQGSSYRYRWSTPDGLILQGTQSLYPVIEGPGTYFLEITDTRNACSGFDSVVVTRLENPMDSLLLDLQSPSCFGYLDGRIEVLDVFSGNEPLQYSLDGSLFTGNSWFTGLEAGSYLLGVRDAHGCRLDSLVLLNEGGFISLQLSGDPEVIQAGESTLLTAELVSDHPVSVLIWKPAGLFTDPDKLVQQVSPSETTLFTIEAIDNMGCKSVASQLISVLNKAEIYLPNAFSPNGDGVNDWFFIEGTAGIASIEKMEIFDRWGNKVFAKQGITPGEEREGWDGSMNGQALLPGVYIFHITGMDHKGQALHFAGDVSLLR